MVSMVAWAICAVLAAAVVEQALVPPLEVMAARADFLVVVVVVVEAHLPAQAVLEAEVVRAESRSLHIFDSSMRFHLLALPNAQTTRAYSLCGFTQATIRFTYLLKRLGHEVILYASEENEAPCDELVTVITMEEIDSFLSFTKNAKGEIEPTPYQYAYIEEWSPLWQLANARMVREIGKRKREHDFIASIGGSSQKFVADAHPDLMFVEYSIGYNGSFSPYRVFESEAWRHVIYGAQQISDGRFFDTVIPCFYDPSEFPFRSIKEPFALYVGRLIPRKGIEVACRAAYYAGVPLKVIGHGDRSLVTHGAEYLGALPIDEKNEWMSRAQCVLTPTLYVEPFNQAAVESQFCGTPVIATDWGGFTETIEQGVSGYRCSYLGEFVQAIHDCAKLDTKKIRKRAMSKYSIESVAPQYEAYFKRLSMLWNRGWDTVDLKSETDRRMKITPFGVAIVDGDTHLAKYVESACRLDVSREWLEKYRDYIPEGGLVCDVGACIGHHSATYSKLAVNGTVHAYEPNPVALECLRHNMAKYSNVVIHDKALGNTTSNVSIEQNPNLGMAHVSSNPGDVKVVKLDDESVNWGRLDFLKIDVEGYEIEVLSGGLQTISRFKPVILIEVNAFALDRYGRKPREVHAMLDQLGYTYSPCRNGDTLEIPEIDLLCLPNAVKPSQPKDQL
jgi:FkbM family methyltransferase